MATLSQRLVFLPPHVGNSNVQLASLAPFLLDVVATYMGMALQQSLLFLV
jgi:hypothetical protein